MFRHPELKIKELFTAIRESWKVFTFGHTGFIKVEYSSTRHLGLIFFLEPGVPIFMSQQASRYASDLSQMSTSVTRNRELRLDMEEDDEAEAAFVFDSQVHLLKSHL